MKKAIKREDLVVTAEFDADCSHVSVRAADQVVQWDPYNGFTEPLNEVLSECEDEIVLITLAEFIRGKKKEVA